MDMALQSAKKRCIARDKRGGDLLLLQWAPSLDASHVGRQDLKGVKGSEGGGKRQVTRFLKSTVAQEEGKRGRGSVGVSGWCGKGLGNYSPAQ